VQFWKEDGVDRVVLAREASMAEIVEIKRNVDIEIEAFIHGAMCSSYSGRCVLSNHFTDRDSNRGGCCQSCRWKYDLFAANDQALFTEEDDSFTMGAKDLCMIKHIPELIEAGVDSFKIEGRMKSIHYVATVVNVYRQAIDAYLADPVNYTLKPEWQEEIHKAANRPLNSGFFFEAPDHEDHIFAPEDKQNEYDFAGLVMDYNEETSMATVQQRNHFKPGQEVEFFGPDDTWFKQTLPAIFDTDGNGLEAARHPLQSIQFKVLHKVKPYDMMRKKKSANK
jgi:putative protease